MVTNFSITVKTSSDSLIDQNLLQFLLINEKLSDFTLQDMI